MNTITSHHTKHTQQNTTHDNHSVETHSLARQHIHKYRKYANSYNHVTQQRVHIITSHTQVSPCHWLDNHTCNHTTPSFDLHSFLNLIDYRIDTRTNIHSTLDATYRVKGWRPRAKNMENTGLHKVRILSSKLLLQTVTTLLRRMRLADWLEVPTVHSNAPRLSCLQSSGLLGIVMDRKGVNTLVIERDTWTSCSRRGALRPPIYSLRRLLILL